MEHQTCPHSANASLQIPPVSATRKPCEECGNLSGNWICLHCNKVLCGRKAKAHMITHGEQANHPLVIQWNGDSSFASIWCYKCDKWVAVENIGSELQKKIEQAKGASNQTPTKASPSNPAATTSASPTVADSPSKHTSSGPASTSSANSSVQDLSKDQPTQEGSTHPNNGDDSDSDSDEDSSTQSRAYLEYLSSLMGKKAPEVKHTQVLDSVSVEGIAKLIKDGKAKNIVVLTGAGISVAAGIPDFRSPGTGLYDNLQKYNLPHPTAVFELDYFRGNPAPFYLLAKELFPGTYKPTACHYFIRLLSEKGLLLRNYTQNIDTLERVAGVPDDKMIEAHGSFAAAHCIDCRAECGIDEVKKHIFASTIPKCVTCTGLIKPDIVFFGESLPRRFFDCLEEDFPKCDLLIVIGTSLKVRPFSSLVNKVNDECPRLLINNEIVGTADPIAALLGFGSGFNFSAANNYRDVSLLGDCQEGVRDLVKLLGWESEFEQLMKEDTKLAITPAL